MIHESVLDCVGGTPVVALGRLFPDAGVEVLAKLEFLNPGGSVKDRAARHIVRSGLADGTIGPGTHLVESTSGNFGIALAMACRIHQIPLTVVVDPNITPSNLTLLRRLGANVEMVTELDERGGGYLNQRLRRVQELLATLPDAYWINQYANELNLQAHQETGREILAQVPGPLDLLVAAVSTTGTIHGVAGILREAHPALRVVAVDAVGSVIFGTASRMRRIPGIGASRVPELLRREEIDQVVHVTDEQAVGGCHALLDQEGILAGGSSGSVVAALRTLIPSLPVGGRPLRIVTLLPDRGERYLDLIYADPPGPEEDVLDTLTGRPADVRRQR
ncbi:2,3-diaminopropionate biosynthesis protein SbnA [Streptomyces sp. NPDC059605]|uniref:2,3-diaminopropionate biosynthesis protein SbnA n=1 Tax=unclassified Streptomyces TaxID=2593676 RepID=UPI0033A1588B